MAKLRKIVRLDLGKLTEAFPYQQEAIESIIDLPYAAIFYEQGLGKTKIAIDLSLDWLGRETVDTVVIVTKKGLVRNWLQEFEVHSNINPRILSSDRAANHKALFSPCRVYITSYEAVAAEEEKLRRWCKHRNAAIILDESQKIKNPNSKLTQAFFRIANSFSRRIIMTGTPMANRPFDIWAQIYFLDFGDSLGDDFKSFKALLDLPKVGREREFSDELKSVFPKISNFAIRETKEGSGLNLPSKEYRTIYSDWEPTQQGLYSKVKNELWLELVKDGKAKFDDAEALLKRLLRLSQIASNPLLVDDTYDKKPGKLIEVEKIVNEVIEAGEKVIIWTSFVENCRFLAKYFSSFGSVQINGSMAIVGRDKSVQNFKNDPDIRVLVATPASAKEGLTLTVANHVIFYDRSFSLDDYLQAQDRIHRISQTKTCFVTNIVMKDSIDEWVSALISLKSTAVRAGMGESIDDELSDVLNVDMNEILDLVLNG